MNLQPISTKQLRTNFPKIKLALEKGQGYTILYRSKPLAELRPATQLAKNYSHLLDPPHDLYFKSKRKAVDLVRDERK
jgi:antitoxin (DNA-binding transcriptional repressor) of toxin-antitoxin stability system